jgi:Concanavalin A-like lectin/glucanases superfamily
LGKGDASSASGSAISWLLGTSISFYVGGTGYTLATPSPILNQWNHIAISRQSGTLRYFINGVQQQSTGTIAGSINNVIQGLQIGAYGPGSVTGYIDEFRILNSCLYSANFTPTTVAYQN